jgi:hypothetical protein
MELENLVDELGRKLLASTELDVRVTGGAIVTQVACSIFAQPR